MLQDSLSLHDSNLVLSLSCAECYHKLIHVLCRYLIFAKCHEIPGKTLHDGTLYDETLN